MGAIVFYLYALNHEEASYVAPLFQLIPIFGFILGFFLLGETLIPRQLLAGLLIIGGSTLLSLEFGGERVSVKGKFLVLMLMSCLFYAANAVIFKTIAIEQGFLNSLFWDLSGKVVFGIIIFFVVRSYREQFLDLLKNNRFSVIGLNVINEILALIGEVALILAVLMAPVALVQSIGGLQPLFVFIIGILITKFWPKFGRESLNRSALVQKIISIAVVTVGVYLLQ